MPTLLEFAGILLAAVVVGFLGWTRRQTFNALIEGSLRRWHAREITIRRDWLDFGDSMLSFEVEYTDANGRRHVNRCKVRPGFAANEDTVYWEHPLAEDTQRVRKLRDLSS